MERAFVTFEVNGAEYGISIDQIKYIEYLKDFSVMPNFPEFIIGISSYRNSMVTLVDLNKYLFDQEMECNEKTRVIGISVHGQEVGLVVQDAKEVLSIKEEEIQPPSKFVSQFHTVHVNNRSIQLIDPALFFTETILNGIIKTKHHVS